MARRPVVLDGGLATLLEATGRVLDTPLWSAQLLLDDPGAVLAAHRAFVTAGAEVLTTASYQLFAAAVGARLPDLLHRSVALARAAGARWVAGSVGPYGASLGGGAEYRGDDGLSVRRLTSWHRERFELLARAGADVLAAETIPSLREAEALAGLAREYATPAWLSVTAAEGRTRAGEPVEDVFALARESPWLVAVGVNCCDPAPVTDLVAQAADISGKPVVAYPNSGERWADGRWTGRPVPFDAAAWIDAGARLVGGCCRVGPGTIRDLAGTVAAAG